MPFDFVCRELHCPRVWFARTPYLFEELLSRNGNCVYARSSREQKLLSFGMEKLSQECRGSKMLAQQKKIKMEFCYESVMIFEIFNRGVICRKKYGRETNC